MQGLYGLLRFSSFFAALLWPQSWRLVRFEKKKKKTMFRLDLDLRKLAVSDTAAAATSGHLTAPPSSLHQWHGSVV